MVSEITRKRGMLHIALLLILALGLLAPSHPTVVHASDTVVTNPALPTSFSWPSWWTGAAGTNDCDASYYDANNSAGQTATLFYTWRGIQACGPRPHNNWATYDALENIPNVSGSGSWGEYMWECPELPARYLRVAFGVNAIDAQGGNFATNYASHYPGVFQHYLNNNPSTDNVYPQEGDVVSMTSTGAAVGHVGIVISLVVSDTLGSGTITIMDQNGWDTEVPSGTFKMTLNNYVVQDPPGLGYHVTDWIHPRVWRNVSPIVGTTADWITSMAATSTSNVFAAGYESGYLGTKPAVFRYNGSSWSKDLPTPPGSGNHRLWGVAVNSATDAWTVGEYVYGTWFSLAYRWNGSSWSRVTVTNPSNTTTSTLRSVALAGSDIFAVGVYQLSGVGAQPLLEKWNGSNAFTPQALSLPSGDATGELNSVAFNSATNGWAVGYTFGSSSNKPYLIYHWNGSSWETPIRGPTNTRSSLTSIAVISDTEAWAVGAQGTSNTPLLMHYTSANGWQEDTSFNGSYPSGAALKGIAADSASNVWIVGVSSTGSGAYSMHYNGTAWTQVSFPADYSGMWFYGVSVVGDYAWAGGYTSSTPTKPLVYVN